MLHRVLPLLLLATPALAGEGPKVVFVKGEATVREGAGEPKALKRGRRIPATGIVATGPKARLELRFDDGTEIRVAPSSELALKGQGFDAKTKRIDMEASLLSGRVWAKVSKLVGGDARFEVTTENAVAGVRGTVFRVNIDRDRASVVKVYQGAVAVANQLIDTGDEPPTPGTGRLELKDAPFQQIDRKAWEATVKQMMMVRVLPDGRMAPAQAFSIFDDVEEESWVSWNLDCDQGECADY